MTIKVIHHPIKTLLWLSDLHLDRLEYREQKQFIRQLLVARYDACLITGDLSNAAYLEWHLEQISKAGAYRPVYFVLGNHDYFGSSFANVESILTRVCARHTNLVPLGHGEIVALSEATALIGHRGWYDGRAGAGDKTPIECPDRTQIDDFSGLGRRDFFEKLEILGRDSAKYIRQVLPVALRSYSNVMIGTHVPPFTQALNHQERFCDWNRQPYFANRAAGNAIWGMAQKCSNQNITVYAGHSHAPVSLCLGHNLSIHVAEASHGRVSVGQLLKIR